MVFTNEPGASAKRLRVNTAAIIFENRVVEVFKTNVQDEKEAIRLIESLGAIIPHSRISFDLADCDRVLRVEAPVISPQAIIDLLASCSYRCEVLE